MSRFLTLLATALVLPAATSANAELKLPAVISDHMVLQRETQWPVWGWAAPNERITVSLAEEQLTTRADAEGRWLVRFTSPQVGGPYRLRVEGEDTALEVNDILVGEVWLCSGQSNMAMTVNRARDYQQEAARADLPKIRMFTTARQAAVEPRDDCQGRWTVCSPESVGGFSATAFFFGRELHRRLGVPVGLLNSSWGGTAIEAWTSASAQSEIAALAPIHEPWKRSVAEYDPQRAQQTYEQRLERWKKQASEARAAGRKPPRRPTPPVDPRFNQNRPANLFNGMIHPLIPFAIRGAIWYQGERNSRGAEAALYGLQLETLIRDWRSRWDAEFPFLWVQLPNYQQRQTEPVETSGWVVIQEQMFQTLSEPNTGMAITIDIGEANDIHPKNKQDVGARLARWALARTYGLALCPSGPLFASARKQDGRMVITFQDGTGPLSVDGDRLEGFAIAGADRRFVWGEAVLEGDRVVVSSPDVPAPVAVRYSWASNPIGNLRNRDALPAAPFRTDNWPLEVRAR